MKKITAILLTACLLIACAGCTANKTVTTTEDESTVSKSGQSSTQSQDGAQVGDDVSQSVSQGAQGSSAASTVSSGGTSVGGGSTASTAASGGSASSAASGGGSTSSKDPNADYTPGNPVKVEDTEKSVITYAGGEWKTYEDGKLSGGSNSYNWDTGSIYTFKFTGVQFEIWSETGHHMGIMDIYIDNKKVTSVDMYTADNVWPLLNYKSELLPKGEHTVKVMNSGKKNADSVGTCVSLDYIIYR